MPATYAHHRFGADVLRRLPGPLATVILRHRQAFDIGLQGPDIYFYYEPLHHNPVSALAGEMHDAPAMPFFEESRQHILSLEDPAEKEAAIAYAMGFLCHFSLDHACHGYIEERIQKGDVNHTQIESEFDRRLAVMDGHDPLHYSFSSDFIASDENARLIAGFFPDFTPKTVRKALVSFRQFNQILQSPNPLLRGATIGVMKLTGSSYASLRGHLIERHPNPACTDCNKRLGQLYHEGLERAVTLLPAYGSALQDDTLALDPYLEHTYGPQ